MNNIYMTIYNNIYVYGRYKKSHTFPNIDEFFNFYKFPLKNYVRKIPSHVEKHKLQ